MAICLSLILQLKVSIKMIKYSIFIKLIFFFQVIIKSFPKIIVLLFTFLILENEAISKELSDFDNKFDLNKILPGTDTLVKSQKNQIFSYAYGDNKLLGYVYLNTSIVDSSRGYSGKPIYIVVGMGLDGYIKGLKIVEHSEPIFMAGISVNKINNFINNYKDTDVNTFSHFSKKKFNFDFVSGATITSMVIDESIVKSSIKIFKIISSISSNKHLSNVTNKDIKLKNTPINIENWHAMIKDGSISRKIISVGDISLKYEKAGKMLASRKVETKNPNDVFIDFFITSASISNIAYSLLGKQEYKNLQEILKPGQSAILLASNGIYSYKGSGYVRGGIFDRFQLIQGDTSIRFTEKQHKRLGSFKAKGSPVFKDIDLFIVPEKKEFNPAKPWSIKLLIHRYVGPIKKEFITSDINFIPPEKYIEKKINISTTSTLGENYVEDNEKPPVWIKIWQHKFYDILLLSIAVLTLTIIFFSQDYLVKNKVLMDRIRLTFLLFTIFWLGFYKQAQLSIINVLTFLRSLIYDFKWDFFLMEPLIFILWCSVVVSLIFWGRGVYCGWLCPFGALQEILNRIARFIKIKQIVVPWWSHERLWPLKYLIFLALFGISLYSFEFAEELAEVEPFKTSIILYFIRSWPYVLYALLLLFIGLFIERFFCRYICPLGAALGIPGRLRMNEWLRRRKECGFPCHRCAKDCMVSAIYPNGKINPNECIQCLNCQTLYYDNHRCPPLIVKREKKEMYIKKFSK